MSPGMASAKVFPVWALADDQAGLASHGEGDASVNRLRRKSRER